MNIVVASDDNFVQHCGTMLVSLLENNKENKIAVYLLSEGLSDENNEMLEDIVLTRGGDYNYILVDSELLVNLPMPDFSELSHISIATYYRLLIPNLLPTAVSKVIYLDCDIIIRKSIQDLWDTNIDNYAVGAIYQMTESTQEDTHRLNIPFSCGYFNAGVLLVNVEYWKEHNISIELMGFIRSHVDTIKYHDQDALNAVLHDKCLMLPCKWNMLTVFFRKNIFKVDDYNNGVIVNSYNDYKNELKDVAFDPSIVHYVSRPKPWEKKCTHPFRSEYYKYLKLTPWGKFTEPSHFISSAYRFIRKVVLILTMKRDRDFISVRK